MPSKILKNSYFVFILSFVFILNSNFIFAAIDDEDEDDEEEVHSSLKYMRDKYIEFYDADFNVVFEAAKRLLTSSGIEVDRDVTADNDLGLQKGMIRSGVAVLSQKTDSAFKIIQKYAYKPPFIRGGVWTSARLLYKILLNDEGNGKISVVFENEFSGFEDHITFKVHFFKTNGLIEYEGFAKIREFIEKK